MKLALLLLAALVTPNHSHAALWTPEALEMIKKIHNYYAPGYGADTNFLVAAPSARIQRLADQYDLVFRTPDARLSGEVTAELWRVKGPQLLKSWSEQQYNFFAIKESDGMIRAYRPSRGKTTIDLYLKQENQKNISGHFYFNGESTYAYEENLLRNRLRVNSASDGGTLQRSFAGGLRLVDYLNESLTRELFANEDAVKIVNEMQAQVASKRNWTMDRALEEARYREANLVHGETHFPSEKELRDTIARVDAVSAGTQHFGYHGVVVGGWSEKSNDPEESLRCVFRQMEEVDAFQAATGQHLYFETYFANAQADLGPQGWKIADGGIRRTRKSVVTGGDVEEILSLGAGSNRVSTDEEDPNKLTPVYDVSYISTEALLSLRPRSPEFDWNGNFEKYGVQLKVQAFVGLNGECVITTKQMIEDAYHPPQK